MSQTLVSIKNSNVIVEIQYRPHTTDEKVIPEVLKKCVYERKAFDFFIKPNEKWLDLGANIGTFSLLCLARQATVVAFEPEPENFALLNQNISANFSKKFKTIQKAVGTVQGVLPFYLCGGDYNKYRHTLVPVRGRTTIQVPVDPILKVLAKYKPNCIKMDIEGSEILILEFLTATHYKQYNIQKLVFEYSFDVDRSIPRFLRIIHNLKKYFSRVHYDKVKENELEYNYFPACTNVFCIK
jgi:FkbM family methyltransferase